MIHSYASTERAIAAGHITRAEGDVLHAYARFLRSSRPIIEWSDDADAIAELAAAEHADPGGRS